METCRIFRFKFSENFSDILEQFAVVHQYDNSKDFKDAYNNFIKNNENIVTREKRNLIGDGYNGDINDKMYRSARYYFKNKDYSNIENKFKDKKKRRQYIKQNTEFINTVDEHVSKMLKDKTKPSDAFKNFHNSEPYSTSYKNELTRIGQFLDNDKDILNKIKKTYKNRYFTQQKN
jgi:hypothetical protein